MGIVIGVVSQKGGVGKSTIARMIAREFAAQDWRVKIGDLDISQATSFKWRSRRLLRWDGGKPHARRGGRKGWSTCSPGPGVRPPGAALSVKSPERSRPYCARLTATAARRRAVA